ncbi:MAG: hypothetical protein Q9166_002513, partial [cf. Caloplaca sp. 2 TL-2023]
AFDAEIRRALFSTNLFGSSKHIHIRRMTPEYICMWLMAIIARTSSTHQDTISSVVTSTTDLLLADTDAFSREQRRLAYVENLCDAIAYRFTHKFGLFIENILLLHGGLLDADEDLFTAAVAVGDLQMVRRLLLVKSTIHGQSEIFGSATENAARRGDKESLALMVELGSYCEGSPELATSLCTALVAACWAGQQNTVEYLLSLSPKVSFSDEDIDHGFAAAARSGHTELLRLLLPRINTSRRHETLSQSLRQASAAGRISAVQLLLDSGAGLKPCPPLGGPLHFAARSGFVRVVRLLLDRGAEPDAQSRYGRPLYFAAKNGHVGVVQILLEHGADIDAKGYNDSVLARAARNGETAMVKYLLHKGVELQKPSNGDRALQGAAQWGHEEIVRLLVGLGVNVNGRGTSQDPPILRAMLYDQQHIIKVLTELGAKAMDPLQTRYASDFQDGKFPRKGIATTCSQWGFPV